MTSVEIRDRRFEEVVGKSVEFEKIATGFLFTEGPLWHRRENYLLFSDMPGDHLRRWSAKDGVTTFRNRASSRTDSPGTGRGGCSSASTPRAR